MLEGLSPKKKDALCIVIKRAAELEKADYDILISALEDPLWTSHGLAIALRERGFTVHKNAIQEHRKKQCACAR